MGAIFSQLIGNIVQQQKQSRKSQHAGSLYLLCCYAVRSAELWNQEPGTKKQGEVS